MVEQRREPGRQEERTYSCTLYLAAKNIDPLALGDPAAHAAQRLALEAGRQAGGRAWGAKQGVLIRRQILRRLWKLAWPAIF